VSETDRETEGSTSLAQSATVSNVHILGEQKNERRGKTKKAKKSTGVWGWGGAKSQTFAMSDREYAMAFKGRGEDRAHFSRKGEAPGWD